MATPKKKPSLEDFLGFNQAPERKNYITPSGTEELDKEFIDGRPVMRKEGNKAVFKRASGTLTKDETGKESMELAPLEADGVVPVEEAQMPRPLKERILPPEPMGDPPPAAQKFAPPAPAAKAKEPEGSTGPSWWERLMIGATPALVGLLSGNEMEGVELSGQTLANTEADRYKRELDFNGKLQEMKAKRALSGSTSNKPNYARQELFDPNTGKNYVHSIVDGQDMGALGIAPPKTKSGKSFVKTELYNPETKQVEIAFVNPETQDVQFYGKGGSDKSKRVLTDLDFQGENTRAVVDLDEGKVVNYLGKIADKKSPYSDLESGRNQRFQDQKLLDLTKEFVKPTGNFNKMKENLDGIVMAADMLNQGNPRANAGLQNYLARNIFGEKGPLSDSDIARLSGDPSYSAVIERFLDARLSGTLNELDRGDIRQILDLAYKVQSAKMRSEAVRFGSAFKSIGYDPTPGISAYVKGAIRELPGHVQLGRGNRSAGGKPKQVVQGGNTYILNEKTGKYE